MVIFAKATGLECELFVRETSPSSYGRLQPATDWRERAQASGRQGVKLSTLREQRRKATDTLEQMKAR